VVVFRGDGKVLAVAGCKTNFTKRTETKSFLCASSYAMMSDDGKVFGSDFYVRRLRDDDELGVTNRNRRRMLLPGWTEDIEVD
jgi:hypothetical protein